MIRLTAEEVSGPLLPTGLRPGADRGDPQTRTLNIAAGGCNSGVWECTPGGWPISSREDTEVCYVLSGRARLTDAVTGETLDIGPGDLVLLPQGWSGRWEIVETLKKVYVLI